MIHRISNFFKKIQKTETCWIWKGCGSRGYGYLRFDKKNYKAHRFSYLIHHGHIPDRMCVLHRCDNPSCVNPDHLFLGTQEDNMKDMGRKKRSQHGSKHWNAKLQERDIPVIFKLHKEGLSKTAIGKRMGVSRMTIAGILLGTNWAHVSI